MAEFSADPAVEGLSPTIIPHEWPEYRDTDRSDGEGDQTSLGRHSGQPHGLDLREGIVGRRRGLPRGIDRP